MSRSHPSWRLDAATDQKSPPVDLEAFARVLLAVAQVEHATMKGRR